MGCILSKPVRRSLCLLTLNPNPKPSPALISKPEACIPKAENLSLWPYLASLTRILVDLWAWLYLPPWHQRKKIRRGQGPFRLGVCKCDSGASSIRAPAPPPSPPAESALAATALSCDAGGLCFPKERALGLTTALMSAECILAHRSPMLRLGLGSVRCG